MTMVRVVERMAGEVDDLARELVGLDASAMAATMRAIGGLVAAAQRLEVRAAAHFTRLGAFRAAGAASTAAWLRTQRGLSGGAAKQVEDAARAIATVAVVRDAFERGALGVEHAALLVGLTDRVRLGEITEAELLPLVDQASELAVDRFRLEVRAVEARLDAAAGHDPARGNTVRGHDGDGGRKVWRAELDPESHDIVGNAMDALVDEAWRAGHTTDESTPPVSELARRRADALVEMAKRSLRGVDGSPAASVKSGRGIPEVTVIIDWATLRDEILRDDSVCKLVDGTPLSPATVRRIACAAHIIPAVLGGAGDVLDLGTRQRLASAAQHRALVVQHQTCAWPGGCDVPVQWCTAHHLEPWKPRHPGDARGPTNLANLAPLCSAHHHLAHEGGWTLTRTPDGTLTAEPPGRGASGRQPSEGTPPEGTPPDREAAADDDREPTDREPTARDRADRASPDRGPTPRLSDPGGSPPERPGTSP